MRIEKKFRNPDVKRMTNVVVFNIWISMNLRGSVQTTEEPMPRTIK